MTVRGELDAHLTRLMVISLISLGIGFLRCRHSDDWHRGLGIMTAGWSAVNLLIVAASSLDRSAPKLGPLREFLALNLGLNVASIAVGICMLRWAPKALLRGMGLAVIIQGAILLALDTWLYLRLPAQPA